MAIAIRTVPIAEAAGHVRRQRQLDDAFRYLTLGFALVVLLVLGGVIVALIRGAWPALSTFGFGFLTTEVWNPVTEKFGALAPIYGTLITSLIAMIIGIPISFGIAVFLTELAPALAAPPGRHRGRAARGHPEHHLRHLGLLRARPDPADLGPAVPDRHLR